MKPLDRFMADLDRARDLIAMADFVDSRSGGTMNASDVRRAALVMLVSALDHYVHRCVHDALIECYDEGRLSTTAGMAFSVSLRSVPLAATDPKHAWLSAEIVERHGHKSFQKPGDISSAVSLVRDARSLWSVVAACRGVDERAMRVELVLIVDRRNQIVHGSDVDPADPALLWPISSQDVADAAAAVAAVVEGIESYLSRPV